MDIPRASLYFALFAVSLAGRNCTNPPPDHVKIQCGIAPTGGGCFRYNEGEWQINTCDDRAACLVWTGIDLVVSCERSEDGAPLSLYHNGSTQGLPNATWTFAVASAAKGLFECRFSNGSLFAKRSVFFDEGAYVIPGGTSSYEQFCRRNIVPDFMEDYNCNVPRRLQSSVASGPRSIYFNILGTRAISIDVETVWVNHYPVDLHLSYGTEASSSSILHNVTLNTKDIVFVTQRSEIVYVVVTVHSGIQTSTLCISHRFFGGVRLFPNVSLPRDLSVRVGGFAEFQCEASTGYGSDDQKSATISFLIQSPTSHDPTECHNCSLSATELSSCSEREDCFDLKVSTSSFGDTTRLTHRLTAQWREVEAKMDGYRVICALAVNGVTQWKKSAQLTLNTAALSQVSPSATLTYPTTSSMSPHVTPFVNHAPDTRDSNEEGGGLSAGALAGISVGAVLVVAALAVVSLAILALLVGRQRQSKPKRLPITEYDDNNEKEVGD